MREIVSYGAASRPGRLPPVVRAAVVFDSGGERRVADDAPLDWRDRAGALHALFARARVMGIGDGQGC